ncbi:MAG TPA: carboxypeptidase-like regulatory domain-containing protein [Bryobacteraceae bacterium]|nr:carboxypeptidase-like regulatory domain-containing protein [Bryobacteraceae bacterium]
MLMRLSAVLLFACAVYAQETRGTIVGRVTDPAGALVPGTEVRAGNVATGVTATSKSNDAGNFVLPYLLPGMYTIEAELAGFKKFIREGIEIRVNDTIEVNVELTVGNVTESVEVRAETPLLATAESSLGQVIDQRRVQELPSFGGSPMVLVQLAPGVMNSTDMRLAKAGSFSINKNSQFSTDGAGQYNNEFSLDGVANTQAQGTSARVGFIPPQTAVSEFKVQTASYDASVSHTIGALVNVTTRTGTNQLHGEAYWWVRNSAFDTPNIFQNRTGQKLPVYQDNRYGLWSAGPVVLPRLYDGRNRTFWFYNWEANTFGIPQSFLSTVPTEKMRRGDLSELLAINSNYQIYDPLTTTAIAGGRFQRQPIPGNTIPRERLDPVALKILQYYPLPNQRGTNEGRNNYFRTTKALEDTWVHLARVDHNFSDKHRAFVRVSKDFWQEDKNRVFTTGANGIILNRQNEGLTIDDVYVLSPAFLLNVRYGITYANFTEYRQSRGFDLTSLGLSARLANMLDRSVTTFPNVRIGSLTQLSNWETGDGGNFSTTHNIAGTITKLHGNHSLRFGADFRVYRENQRRYQLEASPQFDFESRYTRGPLDTSTAPPVGGELASFLLGIPAGELQRTASLAEQDKFIGLFIHDDFKVTRRLTLNLGLRYELETPVTERFNRSVAHFAFGQSNPIEAQARANYARNPIPELPVDRFRVLGGLTYVGVNGNPRTYWEGEKNNLMPRFGFAFQALPKTVLRGGYGIFYDTIGVNKTDSIQTGFSQSTPIQASLDSGVSYVATTADPFPSGLIEPLGASGGLTTNLNQAISFFPLQRRQPYVQRWSFGLQQELPAAFLFESTYVGSRGTRLSVNRNINNTPAEYLSRSPVRDTAAINFLNQAFPNPFLGTNPIYGANISRANLLKPYPQFGNIMVAEPIGYSWYHSLQSRIDKRFSRGFTFQVSHTWSKSMEATEFLNPSDPRPYESISALDRTHRIVGSGIWEMPVGRGRPYAGNMPGVLDFFVGGWQLNGVVQKQSGPPLGFGDVWTLFTGNPDDIVLPKSQRSVDRWFNTKAGFNTNSAQQLASNIRVSPLRFSGIRGDGQSRWDLSVIKTFSITERWRTQFRAECLNAWNHPNLGTPNTTPTNSAFGTISSQDVPRSWQFSLKVSY